MPSGDVADRAVSPSYRPEVVGVYNKGLLQLTLPSHIHGLKLVFFVTNVDKPIGLSSPSIGVLPKAGIAPLKANEIQIGEKIYALSDEFLRKHPGGTVIKSKLGNNATQACHARLSRVVRLSRLSLH